MSENTPAPLNTVTWWEIPTGDVAAGKAFYGAVLGWGFTSFGDDDNYAGIMNGEELIGGLYRAEADPGAPSTVRIYVNVPDLEATLAAAQDAGGSVLTPREEVGGDMGWWAEVADPDGRRLGLCTGSPAAG